jgi:hypothetical protein
MQSSLRLEVREYLRASAKLFGLAFQENALNDAEREAVVSYARELEKKLSADYLLTTSISPIRSSLLNADQK